MPKSLVLVGIDTLAILLGVLVAGTFGENYGGEISPNILLLVMTFVSTRSVLQWIVFKSIIKRSLDWIRSIIQSISLIFSLSLVTFALVSLPTYGSSAGEVENIFLFFGRLQSSTFYYLVVPAVTTFLSFLLHKSYKLEPW